eukprot:1138206-Pelagomonas_calceolata.AAC.4
MHKEHMQEASCKKLHLIPKIHGTCKRLCIIPDGTCRQEASCPGQEAHAGNRLHTIPDKRHMQDAPYDPGRFCAWRSAQNRPDGPKPFIPAIHNKSGSFLACQAEEVTQPYSVWTSHHLNAASAAQSQHTLNKADSRRDMQDVLFFLAGQGMVHSIHAALEWGKMSAVKTAFTPVACILGVLTLLLSFTKPGTNVGARTGEVSMLFKQQLERAVACLVKTSQYAALNPLLSKLCGGGDSRLFGAN